MTDPLHLARETAATPEAAWDALTDPARVARWFAPATFPGQVGEPYRIDFGDSAVEGTVTALEPPRRFEHTWHWTDAPAGETTRVRWEVEAGRSGGARILLTHGAWDEAGLDAAARDEHARYWEGYLDALVELLAGENDAVPG